MAFSSVRILTPNRPRRGAVRLTHAVPDRYATACRIDLDYKPNIVREDGIARVTCPKCLAWLRKNGG
jgi:hypothetical protein